MTLGAASFEFLATNQDLIVKGAQAEAAAKKNYQAIADAAGVSAAAVERSAKREATAIQAASDSRAAATVKAIRAYNDTADAAEKSAAKTAAASTKASGGFGDAAKGALAFGAAAAGVTVGAGLIHEAMSKIVTDTQAANQATFALGNTFGGTAKAMQGFAEANAKVAGRSNTDGAAALAQTRILVTQYGYTNDQIKEITKRSADLSAISGVDLVEATREVVAALRLEGDVAEALGLNLQQNAVQASLGTKANQAAYAALGPLAQSQITYQKFLEQTNGSLGAAADRAKSGTGAYDKLTASVTNLSVALGKNLQPATEATAAALAQAADKGTDLVTTLGTLQAEQTAAQKSTEANTQAWLRSAGAAGQFLGILIELKRTWEYFTSAPAVAAAVQFGPDPQTVTDAIAKRKRLDDAEATRQTALAATRKEVRATEAKAGLEADQAEHDAAVKALDGKKVLLDVERADKLAAVDASTKATLAGIETEARAAAAASDDTIAHLHVLEEAAKREASQRHDDEVSGLEATQKAEEDSVAATISGLEIERDAAKTTSEARRDQAIADLDVAKRARDAARAAEDRAAEDSATAAKRLEDDRHQGAVRGFDAETKASADSKDAQLRDLDDEGKAASAGHDRRRRELEEEGQADHDRHDQKARELEDEGKAASDAHDAKLRSLSDEADADRAAAEGAARIRDAAYEAANRQRDAAHEAAQRDLSEEADADRTAAEAASRIRDAAYEQETRQAAAAHETNVRGFAAEADAARESADQISRVRSDAHDQVLREIDQEAAAAKAAHDQALAQIDRQKQDEDDRHRAAMSAIDEEEQRRQDAVDAQIAALDALDKADQQSEQDKSQKDKVTNAQYGLLQAKNTGNESLIVKAQQELDDALAAISHTQVQRERDTQRDTLKAQKDAIKEEADAKKDAEDALNLQHQREIQAARDTADAVLAAALAGLDVRKTAENDSYAAAALAAKDALTKVLADIDVRKLAESDAYADSRQKAQDSYASAKLAAADALTAQLLDIARRQQEEGDAYAAARQAAEDSYTAAKLAADDALARQLDNIARRTRAEDDAYKAGQDRRAREKTDLDDELTRALKRIADEKQSEDDSYDQTVIRLGKRKTAIGDANKDELDGIAARKLSESNAHDAAVLAASDQALAEKRRVADVRTAEDLADVDSRKRIADAFTNEELDRHARYDDEATGEIPALKRALAASQEHFRERKTAADTAFAAETQQIADTYTDQEKGLIPLAQKAATAVATGFRDQATNVTASAVSQKATIDNLYTNPGKTGLLDYLERDRADSEDKLNKQKGYWHDWEEDLAGPNGAIPHVLGAFNSVIAAIETAGGMVQDATGHWHVPTSGSVTEPAYQGDGSTGHQGGAGSAGGVPSPYRVTFPFDAPYNGPFQGGAAWEGGPSRHRGVDLALPGADNGRGSTVGAFQPGRVVTLTDEPAGGKGVILQTPSGLYNYYGHFDRQLVRNGEDVARGEGVGILGRTGLDPGMQTHVHYEVRRGINGDPTGATIDPVPYMGGGAAPTTGGRTFEFDLFGRHFVVRLPGGSGPSGDVGQWIAQGLQAAGLPSEWLEAMEQIAAVESGTRNADGSVQIGTGNPTAVNPGPPDENGERASGLMQMKPSTFRANRLQSLPDDIFNPVANAAASGLYIKHNPAYGDPRATGYFKTGHFDWRGVPGYGQGGWIDRPSLISDAVTGRPLAIAGEGGRPEWVGPVGAGASGAPMNQYTVPVQLGSHTIETLVFEGVSLNIRRGNLQDIR